MTDRDDQRAEARALMESLKSGDVCFKAIGNMVYFGICGPTQWASVEMTAEQADEFSAALKWEIEKARLGYSGRA